MKRILIVEDEIAYANLLHDKLNGEYEVFEAHDGKEGFQMAQKVQPHLILLDIVMPKMDGLDFLSDLRNESFGKTVKVILLTNLEPKDNILNHVVRDQPSYYFVKSDIELEELLEKIKELIN